MSENRCISCGEIIPEGLITCPNCGYDDCLSDKPIRMMRFTKKYGQSDDYYRSRKLFMLANNPFLYYLISFTWGIITSLIGLFMIAILAMFGRVKVFKKRLYGIFPKIFGKDWGFAMGCFFFTADNSSNDKLMFLHECGHGLQNCLWGPLMIFIVSIPSVIRFWYRRITKSKTPYDAIWFEDQATTWGYNYISRVDD